MHGFAVMVQVKGGAICTFTNVANDSFTLTYSGSSKKCTCMGQVTSVYVWVKQQAYIHGSNKKSTCMGQARSVYAWVKQQAYMQVEIGEAAEAAAQAATSLAELGHLLPCQGLFGKGPGVAAQQRAAVRQAGQQADMWASPVSPAPNQASLVLTCGLTLSAQLLIRQAVPLVLTCIS